MTMLVAGGIRYPLKLDLALAFCRKENKSINILTETHINHDQIHRIRNNWLGRISFFLGDNPRKGCFSCFIQALKVSLRLTLIQKGSLCYLRLLPLMTEFSFFMPLQGIAPISSSLGDVSLKEYKSIWKIKTREIILGGFNCAMDKMGRYGRSKTQRLYRYCSNYALLELTVDNGFEGLWRRENPDSHEFTRDSRSLDEDPA